MHWVQWRRGVCVLQVVMALALGLRAPSASACSPPYPGPWFFTLEKSIPEDGATDVLPDGLIRVSRSAWLASGTEAPGSETLRHEVTVIDLETGVEVAGSLQNAEWNDSWARYWKPASRLLPNRRYALVQSLKQSVSRPGDAQGPTELRTSFSTGDRQVAALSVPGWLEAVVKPYQATLCGNGVPVGPCDGCVTPVVESRQGVFIRVPSIRGGFTFGTYQVEVVATYDTPYDFSLPPSNARPVILRQNLSSDGTPREEFLNMPLKRGTSAQICVSWRVADSLGNLHVGAPLCKDSLPADFGQAPPGPKSLDEPGYLGFGCSLGGAGSAPVALGLLVLLARVRRRTPRAS